jgi:hypothetical protein
VKKSQKRSFGVIAILVMLGTSPLSVSYSFADFGENDSEVLENKRLGVILTEKMVNGKLQIQQYALPDEFSDNDKQRMVSFEEESSLSWTYVNYNALDSGIVLYDGKASKIGENQLEISNDFLEDSQSRLGIPEKAENSEKELSYKVIFSGNIVNSDLESEKIIYIVNSIFFPELTQNMKFLDYGADLEKMDLVTEKLRNFNW